MWLSVDLLNADKEIRRRYGKDWIDLSGLPPDTLADQGDTLLSHKQEVPIYLGYVEPLRMLSPYHEARLRQLFRSRHVILLCSDPTNLPYAWKNGIAKLIMYEAVCPS